MAKLFIGIALVVMLGTAALAFLAHGNVDKLQGVVRETKGKVAGLEASVKTAKIETEKATKESQEAKDQANAATEKLAGAVKEAGDAKKEAGEARLIVETKDKQIAELTDKLAKAGQTPNAPAGPTQEELDKVKA